MYQNMVAINRTPAQVVSQFAKNCALYNANPNDIEIGDIEHRKQDYNYRGETQQNTAFRLTWFTGKGYQVYMFSTGVMVTNPDEHEDKCKCVDCEANALPPIGPTQYCDHCGTTLVSDYCLHCKS